MKRYRLIQARTPEEVVGREEHVSFAKELGVQLHQIDRVDALAANLELASLTDGADAILVGGSGKFSVYDDAPWLKNFFDILGAIADADFPTFASCFGFQGLCMAFGSEVKKDMDAAEVGTFAMYKMPAAKDDPLFDHLPDTFFAQEGHKDRALTLPSQAVHLVRSDRCPFQAMRLGKNVYATQFHPELNATSNHRRFSQYFEEYKCVFGESEAQRILDSFHESPHASGLLGHFGKRIEAS